MNEKNEFIPCHPSSSILSLKRWVPAICGFSHLFFFILLSFPTFLLYLFHSCPDRIIFLCSSICIIIKLVIFIQTFLSLNFIPRGKYGYSTLRSFTFEVLQFESIPLSGCSHIWLFQSPTVKLSHHLQ